MPFVPRERRAHRFLSKRRNRRTAMMRVIEHLIEAIEALLFSGHQRALPEHPLRAKRRS